MPQGKPVPVPRDGYPLKWGWLELDDVGASLAGRRGDAGWDASGRLVEVAGPVGAGRERRRGVQW